MGSAFANFAANKELKDRILFTMVMFFVFRLGVHIPVPGVDTSILESLFSSGNLFGFLDLFSGGALSKFSLFAMSIMQLLTSVIPTLEEWRKDGQEGYKKIQKVTRYFTIFLAVVQAFGMTYALRINHALVDNSWLYFGFIIVVLTAGTCLLMWIGEQITERTFHIPAFESQSGRCYPDHFRFFHYYASGYTGAVRSYWLGAVCRQLFCLGILA